MEPKITITEQGSGAIYEGLSFEGYQQLEGKSHTDLRTWVSGQDKKPSRRLLVGTALHDAVLRGNDYCRENYEFISEEVNLTTKEGREKMAEAEKATGKTILRPSERSVVKGCLNALRGEGLVQRALAAPGQKRELALVAPLEGVQCRCLADIVMPGKCLIDLKTTGWNRRDDFVNAIVAYGYASQAAMYVDLWHQISGDFLPFWFMCVTVRQPAAAWMLEITPEQLAFGREWYKTVLKLYNRFG